MSKIEKNYQIPLLILLVSRITRSIAAGMLAIALPYYILTSLHHNTIFLGSMYAVATLFTAFLGLFFGTITDIWGRKRTLFLASLLFPVSIFLLLLSNSPFILFLAAILGGFSATGSLAGGGIGGSVQPIQNAVLADLTPSHRRTLYYSSFAFLNGLAASLGTLFVIFLPLRDVFITSGVLSSVGTLFILFLKTPDIRGKFRKLEGKITIGKFTLTGLLNGFSQGLITPFLIPFFILIYHLPETTLSSYAFISGLIAACSLMVAPILDRKLGFVKSIVYSRSITVILLLLLPTIHFLPLALLIYFITPALRIMAVPIQQTAITNLVQENERGRALGINQVIRLGGSSIATELSAGLFTSPYIAVPFYLYAIVMGANIYLYKHFFAREEHLRIP